MADVEFIDNPNTGNAAAVPMPYASSWTHVPTTTPAARRTATNTNAARVFSSFAGRNVAALAKQGAPPRGEPR